MPLAEQARGTSGPAVTTQNTPTQDAEVHNTGQRQHLAFPVTIVLKKGDSVAKYAIEIYGYSNNEILELIKKNNPHIKDIERVKVGEKIILPDISMLLQ
jgi:hypothetical protein